MATLATAHSFYDKGDLQLEIGPRADQQTLPIKNTQAIKQCFCMYVLKEENTFAFLFLCVCVHKITSLNRPKQSTSISTLWWRILHHRDNKGSKALCGAVKHCVILQ